ncbi:MAG: ATP phosphoribosyltransferase [Betaproteobacteria bacterium]|nr:ATP phosphoribosyltransferase [Betaproteobacteria bacterium]NBT75070.1 ATP phosphoribosyltransferase [Betaproteobacteria bacterium]NBY13352.1 ATP phosphoribosyltransferase [Betaproteobacteria bacterium]NCA16262.1 ATP phosphoribosyltransferase [Betaproteobacteria bacterium]NDF04280.1 ATP phosphoribosyltransferase [Betaproteobacteria bacterium]
MMTLALSKGRIFDETLPLLAAMGISPTSNPETSRKLILPTSRSDLQLLIVRASDVPTYVQYGAADLGVAGSDILVEHGGDGLYQPVDLGIGRCRMSLAAADSLDVPAMIRRGARLRVATKYIRTTRRFFADRGIHADLIKLYGSMELAPLVGLADVIVDLVSTGATLKANGLREVEVIAEVSSRLIVNQAALKLRYPEINPLVQAFADQRV